MTAASTAVAASPGTGPNISGRPNTGRPDWATGALVLADGTALWGRGLGAQGRAVGEVCFNTSMTGYQEILTDPSYAGQIITFTFPHIGNVGANPEDIETLNPAATPAAWSSLINLCASHLGVTWQSSSSSSIRWCQRLNPSANRASSGHSGWPRIRHKACHSASPETAMTIHRSSPRQG